MLWADLLSDQVGVLSLITIVVATVVVFGVVGMAVWKANHS